MKDIETYDSVWDAIADTPGEAANLKANIKLVKQHSWTQTASAKHCRITQPRLNDLLKGHISRFSLDALESVDN